MYFRIVFSLILSLALSAQQNTISLEVHAIGYPKSHVFRAEVQLKYQAIDFNKIASEKRQAVSKADVVLEMLSTNTHKWDIFFDEKGEAEIKGSPQAAEFNFQRPIRELSNAIGTIRLEGRMQLSIDGKVAEAWPLAFQRPFKPGATYVLLFKGGTDDKNTLTGQGFILKEELEGILAGKPLQNRMPGIIPRSSAR